MAYLQVHPASRHTLEEATTPSLMSSPATFAEAKPCARATPCSHIPALVSDCKDKDARRQHHQSRRERRRFGAESAAQEPAKASASGVASLPASLLFNTLRVEEKIGEGRFGTVWRCSHPVTGAQFACKQVDKRTSSKALRREVECLTRVQGHPNVLAVEGIYESELYLYIVTELCNGGDLFEFLSQRGPLPEAEAKALFCQLADALHHCHTRGVMHRDIKPENVLLQVHPTTGQVTAKLADFGLSKRLARGEMTVGWVGSEPYEAPEVVALKPYDCSADVFSMGVLLFGMLSGTWPTFLEGRVFDKVSEFSWPGWRRMSREAKDLIASMLSLSAYSRPNMGQVVRDTWLCGPPKDELAAALEQLLQRRRAAALKGKEQQVVAANETSIPAVGTPALSPSRTMSTSELPPSVSTRGLESTCITPPRSEGSGSEYSWVGSLHSSPRTLSEESGHH